MTFGSFDLELTPGARNAVGTCLAVQPGERVALVVDEACREIGASLAAAVAEVGARWTGYVIEDLTTRPMFDPPAEILQALEQSDVAILCVHPLQGELRARMRIVSTVERRGIRYAHMVGVTSAIMQQGMRADYRLVDRLSERLRARLQAARRLDVRTAAGTQMTATFDPSLAWVKTSGLINPRYWSNLPAGEVFTTPERVDGLFVCDATVGDYLGPKFGDLSATPLRLRIQDGRLVEAACARSDVEREFWDYCHTDENSDRVGELAFGTNVALTQLIGALLQDEKFPGVHLAFGDPYGSQTGAAWNSRTHVDVLTRGCDVWIDDDPVIAKGRYLLDRLGLG
jgi:leucyl aminopeptidase (aminopeptidase T)